MTPLFDTDLSATSTQIADSPFAVVVVVVSPAPVRRSVFRPWQRSDTLYESRLLPE